jgi:hypothetical protein
MAWSSPNVLMCICASTGSIPESTYTAASAVLVGKESIESALHLGIIRTTSLKDNMIKNKEENIKKLEEVHMDFLEVDTMETMV